MQVKLIRHSGGDEAIAQTAWVSSSRNDEVSALPFGERHKRMCRVIAQCIKNKHRSVLRSSILVFRCEWPIFVDRQIMTHQTMVGTVSESQRYTASDLSWDRPGDMPDWLADAVNDAVNNYDQAIEELKRTKPHLGEQRIRELARYLLPCGVNVSREFTVNFDTFVSMVAQRTTDHAQLEVKNAVFDMMSEVAFTWKWSHTLHELENNNWWRGEDANV